MAAFAATEEQGRKVLHGHCLVVTGLSPDVVSAIVAVKQLKEMLIEIIDSRITASSIPAHIHVLDVMNAAIGIMPTRVSFIRN